MFADFLSQPLGGSSPMTAYSSSPRTRKPAIYRGTPPTFTSSLRCVQSGAEDSLPEHTWELGMLTDGTKKKEGKIEYEYFIDQLPSFPFALSQTQGGRDYMEDLICTKHIDRNKNVIGVFDGHNGDRAAIMACSILRDEVENFIMFDELMFCDLFAHIHKKIIDQTESGTTASVLYLGINTISVGYVGDCSVYLIHTNGIKKITKSHNCNDSNEEKKIIENGGQIEITHGTKRVNGIINITRSLGDRNLHPPMTEEPEIVKIKPEKTLTHILITTDGCDVVEMEEMEKIIRRAPTVNMAATAIRNESIKRKSKDNISVLLVDLRYSPYDRSARSPLADDLCIVGGDEDNPFD